MDELIAAATTARGLAYAPYSRYPVGAAVRSADGRTWTGSNVENVSYGLCLCAERSAIAKMVNEGVTDLAAVAIVTRDGGTPCGMCLQTMLEFAADPSNVKVVCATEGGERAEFFLEELIPHGFRAEL
jgi:cytidine deaminase